MRTLGKRFAKELKARRKLSRKYLREFIDRAEQNISQGGIIGFVWPAYCAGWDLPELQQFIARHGLYVVRIDGCTVGVADKNGKPILKPWRIITNSKAVADGLQGLR